MTAIEPCTACGGTGESLYFAGGDHEVGPCNVCNGRTQQPAMSGSPMDPERPTPEAELRRLTAVVSERHWSRLGTYDATAIAEYIAEMAERETARLRAEVELYRSRCPVTAEDVEARGVTYGELDDWNTARDIEPARASDFSSRKRVGPSDIGWSRTGVFYGFAACWPGNRPWVANVPADVARFIAQAALHFERSEFDILDEMAKGAAR